MGREPTDCSATEPDGRPRRHLRRTPYNYAFTNAHIYACLTKLDGRLQPAEALSDSLAAVAAEEEAAAAR